MSVCAYLAWSSEQLDQALAATSSGDKEAAADAFVKLAAEIADKPAPEEAQGYKNILIELYALLVDVATQGEMNEEQRMLSVTLIDAMARQQQELSALCPAEDEQSKAP